MKEKLELLFYIQQIFFVDFKRCNLFKNSDAAQINPQNWEVGSW